LVVPFPTPRFWFPATSPDSIIAMTGSSAAQPLKGKNAIVTGGARGIGAATCLELARLGSNVLVCYNADGSAEPAAQVAKAAADTYGVRAETVQADMGQLDAAQKIVTAAKHAFASPPGSEHLKIDVLVNNAGVAENAPLKEITAEHYDSLLNVNLRGPIFLTQAVIPYLPLDRSGRIVNVSSVSALGGFFNQTVYGASKAGLEAATRSWAHELAERATVNAVNPGPVKTRMYNITRDSEFGNMFERLCKNTALSRFRPDLMPAEREEEVKNWGGIVALAEDIGRLIGLLCRPEAAWTTGSVLNANGGMSFNM